MITIVDPHFADNSLPAPHNVRFSNRSTKSMLNTAANYPKLVNLLSLSSERVRTLMERAVNRCWSGIATSLSDAYQSTGRRPNDDHGEE